MGKRETSMPDTDATTAQGTGIPRAGSRMHQGTGLWVERDLLLRDAEERRLQVVFAQETRIKDWLVGEQWGQFKAYGGGATVNKAGAAIAGSLILVHNSLAVEGCSENENCRVVRITIKLKLGKRLHCASAYGPTEPHGKEDKNIFYRELRRSLAGATKYDELVVAGDFNCELGNPEVELADAGLPFVVGRCGLTADFALPSQNAEMLREFCVENELVQVSSLFRKPWQRRWTFKGTFGGERCRRVREYDHFLVKYRDRGKCTEFQVAAGTHTESDHRLVTLSYDTTTTTRPKAVKSGARIVRGLEFAKEVDAKLGAEYSEEAVNASGNQGGVTSFWEKWEKKVGEILTELAAKAEKEGRQQKRKPWIGEATWGLIERKKRLGMHNKATAKERAALKSRIKLAVKRDKRRWLEEKLGELRRADAAGNSKEVFEKVRQLAGRARKPAQDLPGGEKNHVKFWTGVLGTERPEAPDSLKKTATWKRCEEKIKEQPGEEWETKELEAEPTSEEIGAAVRGLKRGRSHAGLLPSEVFAASEIALRVMTAVVKRIFRGEEIPTAWLEAAIALLHKSGKKADPGNWRPVALLSIGEKLLTQIILRRVQKAAYKTIDKRQKGSVRGLSCRHAVFRLLREAEKVVADDDAAIFLFVDFRKAYDSLDWGKMHVVLRQLGMPTHLGNVIERIYNGASLRLKLGAEKRSEKINQKCGIRQGSSLSPLLFILCLHWAMQRFEETMIAEGGWKKGPGLSWL
eukprot:g8693.t1